MKHIVWAVIAAAFIFTATAGYSRGFSVGVFGAYSIDGGPIEDTINDKKFIGDLGTSHYNYSRYDTLVIPGAGVFTVYTFSSGLFIRTGAEFYKMVSGGEISKSLNNGGDNHKYDIRYDAFALPVLVGYTLSPDKGRTCLYIYTGVALSIVKTEQEYNFDGGGIVYEYKSDNDPFIPGFAGLIGIEKRFFWNISIMLEYAFYKCETSRKESGEQNLIWPFEYEYTGTYGLPRQQARIGVKYSF